MKNLIIMGPPGAGKGTQAALIVEKYNIPHISTGDMFREAIKNETPMGLEAKRYMDAGQLVPDEVTNGIVKDRLALEDCKGGFLLDGYPRTLEQAKALDQMLNDLHINISNVINIQIDDSLLEDRIVGRRVCKACGATYHVVTFPPKHEGICDKCGNVLTQRKDDTKELVKERLGIYHSQTFPILSYYNERGLVQNVDGNLDRDEAFKAVVKIIGEN